MTSTDEFLGFDQIPSMGGREMGPYLYHLARGLKGLGDVVECGSWLGASIAPVAQGLQDAGSAAWIHCYDRWKATAGEVRKAAAAGQTLTEGQDLLELFKSNVLPIYPRIVTHQGWMSETAWEGNPIELYIDDANKQPADFQHALETFGPCWLPGETVVVLMDYEFYQTPGLSPPEQEKYQCQQRFVDAHPQCFRRLASRTGGTSAWSFQYVQPWDD